MHGTGIPMSFIRDLTHVRIQLTAFPEALFLSSILTFWHICKYCWVQRSQTGSQITFFLIYGERNEKGFNAVQVNSCFFLPFMLEHGFVQMISPEWAGILSLLNFLKNTQQINQDICLQVSLEMLLKKAAIFVLVVDFLHSRSWTNSYTIFWLE